MQNTKYFKVDSTYSMRSIGDHDCTWNCKVLNRSAHFVSLKIDAIKEPVRCKIHLHENEEHCYPLGKYSMCPVLKAGSII